LKGTWGVDRHARWGNIKGSERGKTPEREKRGSLGQDLKKSGEWVAGSGIKRNCGG